jgi:hypothetical protein
MILANHIRGRRRILDDAKKARLCELIDQEGYSVEQAAESLDVSLRTVQRERRHDQDFDHEVRLALQQPADPMKLMEHAARAHWRAAAWLLERTKPEEFARKPVNLTSFKRVDLALRYLQEAALQTVPAEYHEALYRHTQAAIDKSLDCCFPMRGEWGAPKTKQLPFATPLADVQWTKVQRQREGFLDDRDAPGNVTPPPPVDLAEVAPRHAKEEARQAERALLRARLERQRRQAAQARAGVLSPTTSETTKSAATEINATEIKLTEPPLPASASPAPAGEALPPEPGADGILSPKTAKTTKSETTTSAATKTDATESPTKETDAPKESDATSNDAAQPAGAPPSRPVTRPLGLDFVIATVERKIDDECPETWDDAEELDHPDAQDPRVRLQLLSDRLQRHRRRQRRKEREAEKKAKAAKKRAEAQRRRRAG